MTEIEIYNHQQTGEEQEICSTLFAMISEEYSDTESKIWHAHPVWFINGNPIVGYSKQKKGIRLMFWSGADFNEAQLVVKEGKFKDASIFYTDVNQINKEDIKRWLEKARTIQWDYKNIVKRKGLLVKLELDN